MKTSIPTIKRARNLWTLTYIRIGIAVEHVGGYLGAFDLTDESRKFKLHFKSCMHALTLSSVGPPNSTTRKGPDNRRGDDATIDVLPSK